MKRDCAETSALALPLTADNSPLLAGADSNYVPDLSTARGAAATAVKLLDAVSEIHAEDPSGKPFDSCSGHIKFDNVHYRYVTRMYPCCAASRRAP